MGKPKQNGNNVQNGQVKYSDPREAYLSTKSAMVLKELDYQLKDFFADAMKDKAVLAEDQRGLYITGKSYVDALTLDPYRQYNRNTLKITRNEAGVDIETTNGMLYSVAL